MTPPPSPETGDRDAPVLITGGAGFIGSHLAERLLGAGRPVVILDSFNSFYDPARKRANVAAIESAAREAGARVELAEGDIRDAALVDGLFARHRPGACVHIAAMAGVRPSVADPALYSDVNLTGTARVLEGAGAHGCRRVVFASSSSVYGDASEVPFREDDTAVRPVSPYAATKRAGELLCHTYAHLHGLTVPCLRFFTVFGPRQRPDLAIQAFLECARDGRAITVYGDGTQSRDFTFVDDIVDGIVAALGVDLRAHGPTDANGEGGHRVYNIGGSSPVSLNELIATIERVTGKTLEIDRRARVAGDVRRTYADLARSAAELGYRPRVPLAEGIARQWDAVRSAPGTTGAPGAGSARVAPGRVTA